jgi:dATP pyrophosphohydrolase
MSRLVDVYPYHREQNRVKFLIFKRADEVIYPNQWRMIGGKVREFEKRHEAALRELKEETGLTPSKFWTIPSLNQFYDHKTDNIHHIPAFAAVIDPNKSITLNHEHSRYKWISDEEIGSYIKWPEQRRLMGLLADIVINNEIIEEWIIKISQ